MALFSSVTNPTAFAGGGVDNNSRGVIGGGTEDGVGIQGHTQLQSLVDDIMKSEEEVCESCAI